MTTTANKPRNGSMTTPAIYNSQPAAVNGFLHSSSTADDAASEARIDAQLRSLVAACDFPAVKRDSLARAAVDSRLTATNRRVLALIVGEMHPPDHRAHGITRDCLAAELGISDRTARDSVNRLIFSCYLSRGAIDGSMTPYYTLTRMNPFWQLIEIGFGPGSLEEKEIAILAFLDGGVS